ncbi:MAG: hypothetical protein U5L05_13120 [Rubrivivax sp.]|nr:hypothetical protein [Rubrivivax sp.]
MEHYTLGFTFTMDRNNEFTFSYMNAPRQSVTGSSLFNAVLGAGAAGNETISMKQSALGVAWGYRFQPAEPTAGACSVLRGRRPGATQAAPRRRATRKWP